MTNRTEPKQILMCPPTYFSVIDEKNEFMRGHIGQTLNYMAEKQWTELKTTIESLGVEVLLIDPLPECEDMVFTANAALVVDEKTVIMSNMVYPSRQLETPAFAEWFKQNGYNVTLPEYKFEGGGDAIWHPNTNTLYIGYGSRSSKNASLSIRPFISNTEIIKI